MYAADFVQLAPHIAVQWLMKNNDSACCTPDFFQLAPTFLSLEKDRQMTEFHDGHEIVSHLWTTVYCTYNMTFSKHEG